MPTEDDGVVYELEIEVEAELTLAVSSETADLGAGPTEWAFDPMDVEREEVGLRNILGAASALEADPHRVEPSSGAVDPLGD